jgi:hypothetical protein
LIFFTARMDDWIWKALILDMEGERKTHIDSCALCD